MTRRVARCEGNSGAGVIWRPLGERESMTSVDFKRRVRNVWCSFALGFSPAVNHASENILRVRQLLVVGVDVHDVLDCVLFRFVIST